MAGQVGKLTLKAVIDGFEDVQGLGKALKDISEKAKKTDKAFEITTKRIKEFGKATFKTNEGLKGQISAFEKLRGRTDFQGRAYKNLTLEINSLNKELRERLGLEKQIQASTGRRKGTITPGPGDVAFLATGFDSVKSNEDFARRQSALQGLLLQRTFNDLNEKQKDFLNQVDLTKKGTFDLRDFRSNPEFKKVIESINASFLTAEQRLGKGKGKEITAKVLADLKSKTGALNETQLQALSIQDRSNIRSKGYLEVLTKINAEEAAKTQILGAQNTSAANQIAQMEAKKLITDKLISQQKAQAKSFLYQRDKGTFLDNVIGPKGTARFYDPEGKAHVGYGTQTFREMPGFVQRLMSIANMVGIKSPTYSMMQEELAGGYTKDFFKDKTATYFPKNVGEYRASDKKLQQAMFDFPFMGKKFPVEPFDPFGTGKAQAYPKTDRGITAELQNLQSLLPDLVRGSDEWVKVTEMVEEKQKELNDSIKKGNEALKKRREEIAKAVNPKFNQKLLPPAKKRFVSGDTGFSADQYGPQVETQAQLTKRLQETLKARDLNINSIVKHKSKLEEIRNTLKPTSEAFRSVSKSILQADKALSKINANKFSGANLRRAGQSILGAGFVGGPAGFLGAGIGAGIEALRPDGDMAGGAITGGLVASQLIQPLTTFLSSSSTYASDIAKLEIALKKATGEGRNFQVALDTAALVTAKFNVPQEIATRGMTRLAAAVTGAGGTVEHAAIAFHNVTAAIKGTAGSSEDVKSAITAMVQIFSKGRVSAEELSGQLGERFPGAVTKFQQANKHIYKSTEYLQDALKKGEVGLKQLWEFVMLLGDEYTSTAEKIGASDEEAGARAIVQMNALRIQLGQLLKPIGAQFQVIQAQMLEEMIPAIVLMGETLVNMGQFAITTIKFVQKNFDDLRDTILIFGGGVLLGTLMQSVSTAIAGGITLAKVIDGIRNAMIALNISSFVNPWVALAAGIIAAAVAVDRFLNGTKKLEEKAASGDFGAIAEAKKMIKDLEQRNKDLMEQFNTNFNNTLKTTPKPGSEMYELALEAYEEKVEKNRKLIESLTKAIEEGDAANTQAQKDLIETLKATLDDLPGIGGGDGGEEFSGFMGGFKKWAEGIKPLMQEIADVTASAFDKMASHLSNFITTGKLNFKEFARSVLADISRMIAKQMILNMISGMTGGKGIMGLFGGGGTETVRGSIQGSGLNALDFDDPAAQWAKGGVFAKNSIVPYYKGGVVNRPTMFKYGGSRLGIMGEAGPEAILPLQRGRGGKLGVAMQGGGGVTTVNYTGPTLNFNGDEYVPKSAVGGIINSAASKGAAAGQSQTMASLRNSRSNRSRLGM